MRLFGDPERLTQYLEVVVRVVYLLVPFRSGSATPLTSLSPV